MTELPTKHFDAYAPATIAELVEQVGIRKATLPILQSATLGVLAGAFIAFGAMFYTLVITGSELGLGPTKLLGGAAFSLGLILVIIGGAELFTGNNLIVMAWADRKISGTQLLRNWLIVYLGNAVGAFACVAMIYLSGHLNSQNGALSETASAIAQSKISLSFLEAFMRGILCNTLVCLAVWLSFASHHVAGKILAIIFPVSAFVALGFEHSIANMYLIPIGLLASDVTDIAMPLVNNLIPVTLGNIVGGCLFVALIYWLVYLSPRKYK